MRYTGIAYSNLVNVHSSRVVNGAQHTKCQCTSFQYCKLCDDAVTGVYRTYVSNCVKAGTAQRDVDAEDMLTSHGMFPVAYGDVVGWEGDGDDPIDEHQSEDDDGVVDEYPQEAIEVDVIVPVGWTPEQVAQWEEANEDDVSVHDVQVEIVDESEHPWGVIVPARRLQPGDVRWQRDSMRPMQLWVCDTIEFNTRQVGGYLMGLYAYDVKAGAERFFPMRTKTDVYDCVLRLIAMEGLHKRPYQVTLMSDNCGSMVHAEQACLQHGVNYFPLPPNDPRLSMAESNVRDFKERTACMFYAAVNEDGPLTSKYLVENAKYCCYLHDRHTAGSRVLDRSQSAMSINTGKKAELGHCWPWGTPGYAWIPKGSRRRHGSVLRRAVPVLLIGMQHHYSKVYKCLTVWNTKICARNVRWCPELPLGVFPPTKGTGLKLPAKGPRSLPVPHPLFEEARCDLKARADEDPTLDVPERLPAEEASDFDALNKEWKDRRSTMEGLKDRIDRSFDSVTTLYYNPNARYVAEYIRERCFQLDGLTIAEALQRQYRDMRGHWKKYTRTDLKYDLERGHLIKRINDVTAVHASIEQTTQDCWKMAKQSATNQDGDLDPGKLENLCHAMGALAMSNLSWKKHLSGDDKDAVEQSCKSEFEALIGNVMEELSPGSADYAQALKEAVECLVLLDKKRTGRYKTRIVKRGDLEDWEKADGEGFQYYAAVVSMVAVRLVALLPNRGGMKLKLSTVDISNAFVQSDRFPPDAPKQFLWLRDPLTGEKKYYLQTGVLYGARSAPARWQATLNRWLVDDMGFKQGANDSCVFVHKEKKILLISYVDDLMLLCLEDDAEWFYKLLNQRFRCKGHVYLSKDNPIDFLGIIIFEDDLNTYLTMESYIETMIEVLELEDYRSRSVPISKDITDMKPLTKVEARYFMKALGMAGWVAVTVRCECKYAHSRIAQHCANPVRGALSAVIGLAEYMAAHKSWCIYQPLQSDMLGHWRHYSDADYGGNPEPQNKRRSQSGVLSMHGTAPILFGSKASSVLFDTILSRDRMPTAHADLMESHAELSVGAAEVYALSIATCEVLNLSYVCEEAGIPMPKPFVINVDNTTAIAFAHDRVKRSRMKHIDLRQQWVAALRDHDLVKTVHCPTDVQLSDGFTKILSVNKFQVWREQLLIEMPFVTKAK